ncbi:hypothetical protein AVEN_111139-1 [Araneus ventricosus]|uniref:Uncharacterized protein n=1 Tax=Araneus ventricosus TaxID=182803 RepID=A0A4Y2C7V1_ARAVE|nr:hypothetical protein AVEN_111139-1 [Araneus ventricosus]
MAHLHCLSVHACEEDNLKAQRQDGWILGTAVFHTKMASALPVRACEEDNSKRNGAGWMDFGMLSLQMDICIACPWHVKKIT